MAYRRTERVLQRLAARHDAIIAAAQAIAAESGLGAVQIVPVAERAGIAAGTVYRYFPAKTDLVGALIETVSEREVAAVRRAAAALVGMLLEGLIGPLAPPAEAGKAREGVQMLVVLALRALGVVDARARGLVVQTAPPAEDAA